MPAPVNHLKWMTTRYTKSDRGYGLATVGQAGGWGKENITGEMNAD